VPRVRTTKALAQRIDLNYFKRPIPVRRARFWLCLLIPLAGFLWLGVHLTARDFRPYSSGPLSKGHALLTRDCATCHAPEKNVFFARTTDAACKACHDGPIHQASQKFEPTCGSCHIEHRGGLRLIATSNESCAQCHANLPANAASAPKYFKTINSLNTDHPEIAVFREHRKDPGTIRLNHSVHMKKNLLGPRGAVQLECSDCHRPPVSKAAWRFGSAEPASAAASTAPAAPGVPKADIYAPDPARALMTMPKFAESCSACHLLQFDKRIAEQAPHDKPEVVHAYVVKKFEAYIAAHPSELREQPEEERRLPSRPAPAAARVLTPAQWVAERTREAESLLWGKTCRQCHAIDIPAGQPAAAGQPLPKVAASNYTLRWLPQARFDHDAHRGFACASCHPSALTSRDTADILLPALETCKTCHAPGPTHAEARCFECHAYHDWSKRKEIIPTFVPSVLRAQAASATPPGQ